MIVAGHLIVRVERGLVDRRADRQRRAGVLAEDARLDVAHANRAARLIQRPGAGHRIQAQAKFVGNLTPQLAAWLARLAIARELLWPDFQRVEHLRPPLANS